MSTARTGGWADTYFVTTSVSIIEFVAVASNCTINSIRTKCPINSIYASTVGSATTIGVIGSTRYCDGIRGLEVE